MKDILKVLAAWKPNPTAPPEPFLSRRQRAEAKRAKQAARLVMLYRQLLDVKRLWTELMLKHSDFSVSFKTIDHKLNQIRLKLPFSYTSKFAK